MCNVGQNFAIRVEVAQRNQIKIVDFQINWKNQIPEDNVNMGQCSPNSHVYWRYFAVFNCKRGVILQFLRLHSNIT